MVNKIAGATLFTMAFVPSVISKGAASVHRMTMVKKFSDSRLL